ncbi:ABC transporter substrate-binding protein [Nonomuraea sp. PA05]|uniref:ABC transporter substrate-binding protein n=1 Tax=Nonomuraea sp. PA05 TaxID=2604466 RepID=UPI0011DC5E92|nr:ABC transporter substrate-binding protein [Nonomuraea sp. PA05]TYB47231.1 ABC transporter substrate-binding protein [Nonomuraea sp. PA05]
MSGQRFLPALCVAALLLTACGGGGNSVQRTNGPEKAEIRIGMLPLPEVAPIQIAIDKGYFAAEGLKVETELISGGAAAMPDLVSGKLDVLHSNYVSALLASASGTVKVKIVGDAYAAQPGNFLLMTKKGSPITQVADLKGRTVGVNTLNNISTLSVSALLKPAGLRPEDVKFVERPFPEMAGALESGQVDVALLPEPFHQAAAKTLGAVMLSDLFTGPLADFPIAGYLVTDTFAQQNPKSVAAFQRALRKATELARSDSAEVTAALQKYTKIDQATASTMKLGGFSTAVDPARVQRVADLMLEFGYLKQRFEVSSILAGGASG